MLYFGFCLFGVSLNKELSIVGCVLIMYFLAIVIFKLWLMLSVMLGYVELSDVLTLYPKLFVEYICFPLFATRGYLITLIL